MKPSGYAILTALLVVGMCSTIQHNQLRHQQDGYVPAGDRLQASCEALQASCIKK